MVLVLEAVLCGTRKPPCLHVFHLLRSPEIQACSRVRRIPQVKYSKIISVYIPAPYSSAKSCNSQYIPPKMCTAKYNCPSCTFTRSTVSAVCPAKIRIDQPSPATDASESSPSSSAHRTREFCVQTSSLCGDSRLRPADMRSNQQIRDTTEWRQRLKFFQRMGAHELKSRARDINSGEKATARETSTLSSQGRVSGQALP